MPLAEKILELISGGAFPDCIRFDGARRICTEGCSEEKVAAKQGCAFIGPGQEQNDCYCYEPAGGWDVVI